MSPAKTSTALPPRTDRNAYIVWMAIIWAAMLGGFGLDFTRYMHETPPPPAILHIHAAVYVTWLVLVSLQIFLVTTGDIRFHMRLGWAVAIVSAVMVPLGLIAALVDQARQAGHPDYAPQFLALEFQGMFAFSTFIIAGLLTRRNLAEHKRGDDPLRSSDFRCAFRADLADGDQSHLSRSVRLVLQYFWGITLMLIARLAWDWFRHKRVMRSVAWGAALLWDGELATMMLNFSSAWKSSMVALVRIWRYIGLSRPRFPRPANSLPLSER